MSKLKINTTVFAKIREQFDQSQIFLMNGLINKLAREMPYKGLHIFYNSHLTLSSLLQIEALVVSGARVTVTCSTGLKCDANVVNILKEANLPLTDYSTINDATCDIGLDCCAGLLSKVNAKYGIIELTQTGVNKYNHSQLSYPVISVDDTKIKLLETQLGTGNGFVRGFHQLANTGLLGKRFVVIGYGKVGKGIVKALLPFTNKITVLEIDPQKINSTHNEINIHNINDKPNVVKALQEAFCIVTATGVQNLMSTYFDRGIIHAKYLANMGSEDEWGEKFSPDDVLYGKMPLNFCLEYPTQLLFLDPIFYSQLIAIDLLLNNSLQPGICNVPSTIQLDIAMDWLLRHSQSINADDYLENILANLPAFIYWKDLDSVYSGCNMNFAKAAGLSSPQEIIGKTDYELPWGNTEADLYKNRDQEAFKGNSSLNFEETQLQADGTHKTVLASKIPLRNQDKKIVGVLGIYSDITDRKEKERLQIVNQIHQIEQHQQEKFRKIVGQMAHDIRSPLSTLRTLVQNNAKNLPEHDRTGLQRAAINIEDITNHMLNNYKPKASLLSENNQRQHVLVSMILAEIASERRIQYKNSAIQFEVEIDNPQINNFVFIQIEPSGLRRMLSNLLNNAAEALPKKTGGKITLELRSNEELVTIAVRDNGKGIPLKKLQQLRQGTGVTTNKKTGYGIGLTQVFDVIENNYGVFEIDSSVGSGTTITIRFPKAIASQWLATKIEMAPNDTIVIVDDDESIHHAWDSRIKYILEKFPNMTVKHFTDGKKALEFMAALPDKNSALLLTDYELLNQELNGLQIIKQSGIKHSILVTSHYENKDIRKTANKQGILILPKDLAHSVPFKVDRPQHKAGELVDVHMVIVDDEYTVVDSLISDYYSHLVIDTYSNPHQFLNEVEKYPKNTRIIVDNNYYNGDELLDIKGYNIAKQLHDKGFTNLFLYSYEHCHTPDYLKLILKTDKEAIKRLDQL